MSKVMKQLTISQILFCIFGAFAVCDGGRKADRPNVLLIAIDDLNDWVGCLNGHPNTNTPNIDRLASRGTLFSNAHCQAPICNPSRTSIMSGKRPSSTGIYDNSPNTALLPGFFERHLSMPRHFAANGYKTMTVGKIYHTSKLPKNDFEASGPHVGQTNKLDKPVQEDFDKGVVSLWDFGPQHYPEEKFNDHVVADWSIEQLKQRQDRPFFLALGFYRPHTPLFSPARIYNDPELSKGVQLPPVKENDLSDISEYAKKLAYSSHPPKHAWFEKEGKKRWEMAVRSYLACVRWTDEQVGRVLDALEAGPNGKNTMIVLYSDHGFHLGEKRRWAKWTLWERSTRVPLIVSLPDGRAKGVCHRPVELLSIYPTLVELCGLSKNSGLEGASLAPLLADTDAEWPHAAITTYLQNNHSIRTEDWRYIRYADGSEELYDHRVDSNEWNNLAGDEQFSETIERLRDYLPEQNSEPQPLNPVEEAMKIKKRAERKARRGK